ncbi:MAG: hypothetical protein Q7S04_01845 [Candidatus Moranbacteria bacterium]|nr:hypothetical protein [Candidatus Moranbacteria bacterium]
MEEEKKTRTKKSDINTGFVGLLLESVFKGIQSSFDEALLRVHQAVHAFTRKLARRVFLFFFAFLGLIFLLIGLAELLSTAYRFPGAGETLMGMFILLISLVLYVFGRDDHSTHN